MGKGPSARQGRDSPGLTTKDKLSALGLGLEVRWVSRAETIENHVLGQRPAPLQKLAPKSVIEVVVNR